MAGPREAAITLAMADDRRRLAAARGGRWRPELPGFLVTEVNGLAGRIGNGIVAPGGEAIHLAVARPGVTAAGLGDQATEVGVGEHVGPRRRRPLAGAQSDDVLPAIRREPAETIVEEQRLTRRR